MSPADVEALLAARAEGAALPLSRHRELPRLWHELGYLLPDGVTRRASSQGDQVTRDGSQWTLMQSEPKAMPGTEGSGWQLSVKRGQDGRHGVVRTGGPANMVRLADNNTPPAV